MFVETTHVIFILTQLVKEYFRPSCVIPPQDRLHSFKKKAHEGVEQQPGDSQAFRAMTDGQSKCAGKMPILSDNVDAVHICDWDVKHIM